jgi:uncharacterized circularly permuted ATP-grasp superfamily protein
MKGMLQSRSGRLFEGYEPLEGAFDEFFGKDGQPHPRVASVVRLLNDLGPQEFRRRQKLADTTFLHSGVTFSVYGSKRANPERIFPFDPIPRIVPAEEWRVVERGLVQRIRALNLFLNDVYGEQRILAEGIVPRFMVESSKAYLPKMRGIQPPKGVYIHIAGVDLIRGRGGRFLVLEDNVRTPSGVSYVLENRMMMKKVFAEVFRESAVEPIEMYPTRLREAMAAVAPGGGSRPHCVVLTPGAFNSAYFEHSFLARRMGCELVQGSDLFVEDDRVYAKTTQGPSPVDVVYRRVDDAFLDPDWFRPDSLLGVPGLVAAYARGNVALVNAIGNGVADDKGVYPYVPDMIRFYLSEEPILGQVPTYICDREDERRYVLEHLGELVVKAVNESGGYGMLMGPSASRREQAEFRKRIEAQPRNYIAQPLVELSGVPTWTKHGVAPRRVDLRPFVLTGESIWALPGGLTRVALVEGSYVVNSSQGGGSKDTWVVEERRP